MPQNPQNQPSTAQKVGEGYKALQEVMKKSNEANAKNPNTPKKQEPPAIDTGSVGGFLSSLKNRASYAIFGPDEEKK